MYPIVDKHVKLNEERMMDWLKIIVNDIDGFFAHLPEALASYGMDMINVKKIAVFWVVFVLIGAVTQIVIQSKKRLVHQQNFHQSQRKKSRITTMNQLLDLNFQEEDIAKIEQKSRVMMDYRKKLRELHVAADKCNRLDNVIKCIDIVSRCPPLVNVKCSLTGLTPFHRICCHRQSCLISFMLSHGADPRLKTNNDENALCLLIRSYLQHPKHTDFTALKILLDAGCYLDRNDMWYKHFLGMATLLGHKQLALWLMDQSAPTITRQKSVP